jgi:N-methylhydantoinase B/oxoprolinase/acetone carboxylase alpha subunit
MLVAWSPLIVGASPLHRYLVHLVAVRIPSGSLLSPSRIAAVCGGNVLTSQRIVDVVLRAFHACAASQGCTNNLTFGAGGKDSEGRAITGWGYYEVCGCGRVFLCANADRPCRQSREVREQAQTGMERQGSTRT